MADLTDSTPTASARRDTSPDDTAVHVFPLAPMDGAVRVSTLLMAIFLAVSVVAMVFVGSWVPGFSGGFFLLAGILAAGNTALVVLVYLYSRPLRFEISPEGMRIVWPGRSRKLPKAAFAEMRIVTSTDLGPLTRRFGVRGIFGCFGWFTSRYMGNVDAYVTRHDNLVYLRLKNRRPLLLTPASARSFLDALKAMVEGE